MWKMQVYPSDFNRILAKKVIIVWTHHRTVQHQHELNKCWLCAPLAVNNKNVLKIQMKMHFTKILSIQSTDDDTHLFSVNKYYIFISFKYFIRKCIQMESHNIVVSVKTICCSHIISVDIFLNVNWEKSHRMFISQEKSMPCYLLKYLDMRMWRGWSEGEWSGAQVEWIGKIQHFSIKCQIIDIQSIWVPFGYSHFSHAKFVDTQTQTHMMHIDFTMLTF